MIPCFWLEPTGKTRPHTYTLSDGTTGETQLALYRRADTGEEMTLQEAPAGAMWDAHWYGRDRKGGPWLAGIPFDGRWLCVKTPGGDWLPDMRARNCTMSEDNEHRCWIRHGEPPNVTVDKNGRTCSAGAGSIMVGNYHGFLRAGQLVSG